MFAIHIFLHELKNGKIKKHKKNKMNTIKKNIYYILLQRKRNECNVKLKTKKKHTTRN